MAERQAYFFKSNRYLRYNIDTDLVDVGPIEISTYWTNLPAEFQSDLDAVVNWGDGHAYFFKSNRYVRYNIDTDLVDVGPIEISTYWTNLPAEFQSNLGDVINWSLRLHWENVPDNQRIVYFMERLVDFYGYPVNGAAGLAGNILVESFVIPTRIEGSNPGTPMRANNFQGQLTDFGAEDIMNRDPNAQIGPTLPGVGLAQWTSPPRRAGLFSYPFNSSALGFRVLFNMDAQIDYLVHELRTSRAGVNAVLQGATVSVNDASDEVLYNYEVPGAILQGGAKLPRTDPAVQQVFGQRRQSAQRALTAYRAAHP